MKPGKLHIHPDKLSDSLARAQADSRHEIEDSFEESSIDEKAARRIIKDVAFELWKAETCTTLL